MKIGIDISVLIDSQRTGIAVYVYQLVNALIKTNKQDKFILFGLSPFAEFKNLNNLSFKKYPNVEMKIYKMPSRIFRSIFLIWQKVDWPPIETFVGEVDIFHSFNWYLPPQRKGKKVATIFDMTPILYSQFHQTKTIQLEKIRFSRIKKNADLVITISQNSKKDFLKFAPNKKVEIIYPGVSSQFSTMVNQTKTKIVLQKYHLQPGYFLSVSTLEPRKNLLRFLQAYLKSGLKEPLVLVGGEGWKNKFVLDLIKKHQQKIIRLGFVSDEDLVCLYQQALCLVYPSMYEGFGMPVLEALSCGTPVICSNTSSLPEVGGKAVEYIDPKREEDITVSLIKIEKNKVLRRELSKKGNKQARKFSWHEEAKKLSLLYQQLLS